MIRRKPFWIKSDLKDDGYDFINDDFHVDAQQFELLNSQNEAQIQIVEEMVRLSERLDMLERRMTKLGTAVTKDVPMATIVDSEPDVQPERREVQMLTF